MLDCHDRITVLEISKTVYTVLFIVLVEHIPYNTIIIPSIRAIDAGICWTRSTMTLPRSILLHTLIHLSKMRCETMALLG